MSYFETPPQTIDGRRVRRIQCRHGYRQRRNLTGAVVVLNETGRDCDGYDIDQLCFVKPAAVEGHVADALEWADGPMSFHALSAVELECWYADRDQRERHGLRKGWDDDRF